MLPAWFVTYDYEGKHNTILVNGQTGKVVGGIPWDKKRFISLLFAAGLLLSGLSYLLLSYLGDMYLLVVPPTAVFFAVFLLPLGIATLRKVSRSVKLTQAGSIFNFVKKRQG